MSEATTQDGVYKIPGGNFQHFQERMATLSRRATRLGCEVGWKETGQEQVVIVERLGSSVSGENSRYEKPEGYEPRDNECVIGRRTYHLVEVTGERPKLNGWRFLATLQHGEGEVGTIVRVVPGEDEKGLEVYRKAGPTCGHCRLTRRRNDTYVVRHDDGRVVQVGSACLKDFTGHASPETLARQAEWLIRAADLAASEQDEDWGGSRGRANREFSSHHFLAITLAAIRSYGWLSRTKARELDRDGAHTSARVQDYLIERNAYKRDARLDPTAEDEAKAVEILDWARDHFSDMGVHARSTQLSQYEWNLWVVVQQDWITGRETGLLGSLVSFWQRETAQEVARRQRTAKVGASQHFGAEKQRGTYVGTVTFCRSFESEGRYGSCYTVVKFLIAGRDVAVWNASGNVEADFPVGATFEFTGTVVRHDVRDGVPETKLNRVKVLRETEALVSAPPAAAATEVPFTRDQNDQFGVLRHLGQPYSPSLAAARCATCKDVLNTPTVADARAFLIEHRGHQTELEISESQGQERYGCGLAYGTETCSNEGVYRLPGTGVTACESCVKRFSGVLAGIEAEAYVENGRLLPDDARQRVVALDGSREFVIPPRPAVAGVA